MPSRKRTRQSTALNELPDKNNIGDADERQESVARKLKKRMLAKPSKDCGDDEVPAHASVGSHASVNDSAADTLCNFSARRKPPSLCPAQIMRNLQSSLSFVHYLYGTTLGSPSIPLNKQSVKSPIVRELEDLSLFRTASPFDRRVTALEWHPTNPGMVVAGSKGGDIILWNSLHQNLNDNFIQGIGPGGSVQAIKFWPWNSSLLLTASIDGRVTLNDFEWKNNRVLSDTFNCHDNTEHNSCYLKQRGPGGNISGIKFHPSNSQLMFTSSLDGRLTLHDLTGRCNRILLNTFTWDFWYCCVDVSAKRKAVVTGDNVGNTMLLSLDGKKLWSHRLHKQKVTHAEFSPREDWLFCTASTDHMVKMWDIRKVSGRDSALHVLKHDKPINSAYFSRTDGCRLLTTDQNRELRVYQAPEWQLERTIPHPHRFFQHITPIKASWHPLQDLIVVGRYPAKDFPGYVEGERRTIDLLDADNGKIVCQLHDPSAPGIVSLNKFNDRGDYLVSGMGVNLLLWGRKQEVEERQLSLLADERHSEFSPLQRRGQGSGGRSSNSRSRPPSTKQTKSKKDTDTKMKMKLQTKTKTKTKNPK